jgi:hypothetical protein
LNQKSVAIIQSNYIPWKGYFDIINRVDDFVLFDTVQYTKRDWRNRNQIKTSQGLHWLSIPVVVESREQKINQIKIASNDWTRKHLTTLIHSYSKAPFFDLYIDDLKSCFQEASQFSRLSDVNLLFIRWINEKLNINTNIHLAEDFQCNDNNASQHLLDICIALNANKYLSGKAAESYLDESLFTQNDILIEWVDYSHYQEYQQLYGDFTHYVSVLDLLFNKGPNAIDAIK